MKFFFVTLPVILSILLTIIVFFDIRAHNQYELKTEFIQKAKIMTRTLDNSWNKYIEVLYAIKNFYDSSKLVDRFEFKRFVTPMIQRYPGIRALEWIPYVRSEGRMDYEKKARENGFADFHFIQKNADGKIITAAQRDVYFPVFYIEPYKNNETALGFDLGSNTSRKKSLLLSMETGKPVATEKISLVQGKTREYGVLIFIPVYQKQISKTKTIQKRIKGFVSGVFNIGDLVFTSLKDLYPMELSYCLLEISDKKNNEVLFVSDQNGEKKNGPGLGNPKNTLFWKSTLDVAGQKWSVLFYPTKNYLDSRKKWDAVAALILGILFSGLLGSFLFVLIQQSKKLTSSINKLELENFKRKQAQKALKNSDSKARKLIESAPDALLLVDKNGNIVFTNKQVETVFGYSPDELSGKWHDILVPEKIRDIHMHHRKDYFASPYTRPMGEGLELWGLKKGGRYFPVEITLSPLVMENETQVICIVRDISKRKKNEHLIRQKAVELNSLYEIGKAVSKSLSMDQVIQSAIEGIQSAISPDVSDIFLKRGDRLIPNPEHKKFMGWNNGNTHFHKVGECLCGLAASTKNPQYSVNILNDDRCTWTECKNAGIKSFASLPLIGKEGLIGVMGIGSYTKRDFSNQNAFLETLAQQITFALENALFYQQISTHAQELEQKVKHRTIQLQTAKEKAESADRLKSSFLASMSHELRTPLNSIIGFTGIILQGIVGPLNDEQIKQLTMVKASANHLLSLINDILDLSKIEAQELTVQKKPIQFETMLEKVVQTLRPLSAKKKLALSYTLIPIKDPIISDAQRLEQILINLINNAIKFTEKGSVQILAATEDNLLKITIKDTGIGIKPEDLETIFETFHQTDTGLARKYEGTGLGLSICKKLIQLLGGDIWAESNGIDQGSTFVFTLPIDTEEKPHERKSANHRGQ